jgi:hypothetical protein
MTSLSKQIYIFVLISFATLGCDNNKQASDIVKPPTTSIQAVPKVRPLAIQIQYHYDDSSWSFYDIPSSARAFSQFGVLVGEAKIERFQYKVGQSITEFDVTETIYDGDGSGRILYVGKIRFETFTSTRGRPIKTTRIQGIKPYEVFTYWPRV